MHYAGTLIASYYYHRRHISKIRYQNKTKKGYYKISGCRLCNKWFKLIQHEAMSRSNRLTLVEGFFRPQDSFILFTKKELALDSSTYLYNTKKRNNNSKVEVECR